MAETGTGTAPTTPATGQGQPAPTQPSDSISIPRSEYETYVRNNERLKGADTFYKKANAFGFKSTEDFDAFKPKYDTLTALEKRGFTHDKLGRMFSEEAEADLAGTQHQPSFDPAKFKDELRSEWRKETAMSEYDNLTKAESKYVDDALREILGDEKVDDFNKSAYKMAVERWLDQNRELYPKDHPLASERLQPFGEANAKKAVEHFKKLRADAAGSSMKNKADAANKRTPTPSPAGNSGGQGKPKDEPSRKTAAQEIEDSVADVFAKIQ